MRREVIALLPVIGLSAVFVVNQGCATKPVLEEVQKEKEVPKKNIEEAKNNLKEARGLLGEARNLLESAREKIAQKLAQKPEEEPEVIVKEEEKPGVGFGKIRVGWCDTLWDISEKVYNNSLYWPAIYDLNRDKVGEDPWILSQGVELKYKMELTQEEKDEAVKEAIAWALKFKDRRLDPKCPPK
jgi:hypothetical protein